MPSTTTFLSLPRELRDSIYTYALSAHTPIYIRSKRRRLKDSAIDHPEQTSTAPLTRKIRILHSLAFGLFWTNFQISQEAADVFYRLNTFGFVGRMNWLSLSRFLSSVGDANRAQIRSLIVDYVPRRKVYLHSDGTILERNPQYHPKRTVLAPELHPPLISTAPIVAGHVDSLDPATKSCFEIIGTLGPHVKLTITHDEYGAWLPPNASRIRPLLDDLPIRWPPTTYLPEMLERFAKEETGGRVKIVWTGFWDSENWALSERVVEYAGWEIVKVVNRERPVGNARSRMFAHWEVRRPGFSGIEG